MKICLDISKAQLHFFERVYRSWHNWQFFLLARSECSIFYFSKVAQMHNSYHCSAFFCHCITVLREIPSLSLSLLGEMWNVHTAKESKLKIIIITSGECAAKRRRRCSSIKIELHNTKTRWLTNGASFWFNLYDGEKFLFNLSKRRGEKLWNRAWQAMCLEGRGRGSSIIPWDIH